MNQRIFYKCNVCGNIFSVVENGGGKPVCCGQPMEHLEPNTQDAAVEKHVPVGKKEGNLLVVKVGEVPHPQTKEHHISFIATAQNATTQWMNLNPEDVPEAVFELGSGEVTIYAYCNLHGLWMSHLDDEFNLEDEICSAEFTQGCTNLYN